MTYEIQATRINQDGSAEKITLSQIGVVVTNNCKQCPARAKCIERQGR